MNEWHDEDYVDPDFPDGMPAWLIAELDQQEAIARYLQADKES